MDDGHFETAMFPKLTFVLAKCIYLFTSEHFVQFIWLTYVYSKFSVFA